MSRALPDVAAAPAFRPDPPGGPEDLDLSSNENLLGPSPKAMEALMALRPALHVYPDPWAEDLCRALAGKWKLRLEEVLAGPGAVSILDLAARSFLTRGHDLVAPHPSFKMYTKMALLGGATLVQVPLRQGYVDLPGLHAALTERTRMVVVCHPNNPTGTVAEGLEDFLEDLPEHVVAVVDEAYAEFAGLGSPGRLLRHARRCGLLVLRSFSKLYGLAGLRMGAAVGTPAELDALRRCAPPYWTSAAAQWAAREALEDGEFVERSLEAVRQGLQMARLRAGELGWTLYDSKGNFFCVHVPGDDVMLVRHLRSHGLVVAPCTPLGLPGAVRVAAASVEGVERFFDLAASWQPQRREPATRRGRRDRPATGP